MLDGFNPTRSPNAVRVIPFVSSHSASFMLSIYGIGEIRSSRKFRGRRLVPINADGATSAPMPGRAKNSPDADPRPLLPNYVRQWRQHRKLTLEDLAGLTGLAVSTISEIERGVGDFTGKTLLALARALETSPAALIGNPPNEGDIWSVWDDLGRQSRRMEATAVLRALRDASKK